MAARCTVLEETVLEETVLEETVLEETVLEGTVASVSIPLYNLLESRVTRAPGD